MATNLPTGTVTFLFTDIERSTRRWEEDRQAMSAALAHHDTLLHQSIEANGGYVFKTVGDAFYTAFPTAPQALQAALSAQRALHTEDGVGVGMESESEQGRLRVRIALHTGAAEERGGDYFGPPVNRVARILSAAHGGQVLLSDPAYDLVRDTLPAGVKLHDLGEHRLKDLTRPERIFQVIAPGLPEQFPPLRTLDNRPNNLPLQPTLFIGREKELAALTTLLLREDARLVTLTGPGGTGKTRLGLQVGAELIDDFEDGVFFVNLAAATEPALVTSEIAQTLGVREAGDQALSEVLKRHLSDKRLLLVLDNFEQVMSAAAALAQLLSAAPGVKMLVTSRVPLRLRGEKEYPVAPLSLPDPKHLPSLERLAQYEAVRLFIERAVDARPDFQITNENAPAVAEICHRLDGLPLAIELAAARIKLLPPQAMLARLSSRLKLLTGGARDLPARQQTLRGAIEWSHDLLNEGEQQLFRRLAVFAGGRSLEAIEAVCNAQSDLQVDVLDGLGSLIDKSLLRQEEDASGEPRFVMLETIHEYAQEKLEESGEAEEMRRHHALYFLALAEDVEPKLRGSDQTMWFDTLEEEQDNLWAALRWAAERGEKGDREGVETGLRIGGVLWYVWWVRGYFMREGREQLERLLTMASSVDCSGERVAKALNATGVLALWLGDYPAANSLLERALVTAREHGDKRVMATSFWWLGAVKGEQRDYDAARALYEEALALHSELGNKMDIGSSLDRLATVARLQGDDTTARALYKESLALFRELGVKRSIATSLSNLGHMEYSVRDYRAARSLCREGLVIGREVGDKYMIACDLIGLGGVAAETGQPRRAARLLGVAEALIQAAGTVLLVEDRVPYDQGIASARSQLGEGFEKAWEEGRTMTMEQAVGYALET